MRWRGRPIPIRKPRRSPGAVDARRGRRLHSRRPTRSIPGAAEGRTRGRDRRAPFAGTRSTGTPSPGGISWREAQYILERCVAGRRVVGLDVVELAPIEGLHHADFTAAKLTHLIMGLAHDANLKEQQA